MPSIPELTRDLDDGLDVYKFYIDSNIQLKKRILSPLRDERDPSFVLYRHSNSGEIWFKDHGADIKGNHWTFVSKMFGIDFKEAVRKVKADILGYQDDKKVNVTAPRPLQFDKIIRKVEDPLKINTTARTWADADIDFWNQFGISLDTLNKFNVEPLLNYEIVKGEMNFKFHNHIEDPIYGIMFKSGRKKIYRPRSKNPKHKWTSNLVAADDIFGLQLCPPQTEHLFLMAGNKDTMAFYEQMKMPALALASESTNITEEMQTLFSVVAENVWVFYDNDKQGYKKAKMFEEEFGYRSLNHLLQRYDVNDFADLVHLHPDKISEFSIFLQENISK